MQPVTQVQTVFELTQSIKQLLEGNFKFVAVQGEVSNCKLQTSGHLYFSLKDATSQISAVMFKTDVGELQKIPKDGDLVILKGSVNVYAPTGKYQIVAKSLEFAGLGALLLKLEELKIKLKNLGYFKKEHKKPLPKLPKKIGVVTSPTGAVIQDILNVLKRRFSGFHLILHPVKVQGEGAADEIAAAIDYFNEHNLVDVMIIGRGGGSIEDLFAFNEEVVAHAIYRSHIPIISAVGHETDHCIADYVADVRAPTPSAAAEIVLFEKTEQLRRLNEISRSLKQAVAHQLISLKNKLSGLIKHPFLSTPYGLLGPKIQQLDDLKEDLDQKIRDLIHKNQLKLAGLQKQNAALNPRNQIGRIQEKLLFLKKSIDINIANKIEKDKKRLEQIKRVLHALDPKNVLAKGYSIVFSEKGKSIITSAKSLSVGDAVQLLFLDGDAYSTINKIVPK